MRVYTNLYGYEAYDALNALYDICICMADETHSNPLRFVYAPVMIDKSGELVFLAEGKGYDEAELRGIVHLAYEWMKQKYGDSNPLTAKFRELEEALKNPRHKWRTPLDPIKQSAIEALVDSYDKAVEESGAFPFSFEALRQKVAELTKM